MRISKETSRVQAATERRSEGPSWDFVVFCAGLLVIGLIGGIAIEVLRLPPSATIHRALEAASDWRAHWRSYLHIRSEFLLPTARTVGGVTRYDPAGAWNGYTLVTMYRDGRFGVSLLDMHGSTVHKWDVAFSKVWPAQHHLDVTPPDDDIDLHGVALLPGGGLAVNFDGSGVVRLDRCSRVVSRVSAETHHAVDVLPDGTMLIPARHKRYRANPRFPRLRPGPGGYFYEDTVLRARPDGSVIGEVSVLDILYRSGWEALLLGNDSAALRSDDPTHLNDAEMLRPEMAAAFPMFRAGDVLLSLRHLNTIMVVDGTTWQVKWTMTGPFVGQHDPDFTPNGHILLFDNRRAGTSDPTLGYSRILEIDPASRQIVWSFQGTPEEPFYSEGRGKVQLLPNGNVLAVEPDGGRVVEIARGTPNRIVWEFVNLQRPGFVGDVLGADRISEAEAASVGKPCDDGPPARPG